MEKIEIEVMNPWSKSYVTIDITNLEQEQLDAYMSLVEDEIREELHSELAPCTPAEFLAAYVERVGPEVAGSVILGS